MTTTEGNKSLVRIFIFMKRREGSTREQFLAHWAENHGPLAVPMLLHFSVVDYTQIHRPASLTPQGMKPDDLDYDGIAELQITDFEEWGGLTKHPYFQNVVSVDERRFLDTRIYTGEFRGGGLYMPVAGFPRPVIVGGKVVIDIKQEIWDDWKKWDGEAGKSDNKEWDFKTGKPVET